jgi:hypothetical protein
MKISEFVKDGNKVYFQYFRAGILYYSVKKNHSTEWYIFPVPVADTGNASMLNIDKALTFMRWIRKAIDNNELCLFNN